MSYLGISLAGGVRAGWRQVAGCWLGSRAALLPVCLTRPVLPDSCRLGVPGDSVSKCNCDLHGLCGLQKLGSSLHLQQPSCCRGVPVRLGAREPSCHACCWEGLWARCGSRDATCYLVGVLFLPSQVTGQLPCPQVAALSLLCLSASQNRSVSISHCAVYYYYYRIHLFERQKESYLQSAGSCHMQLQQPGLDKPGAWSLFWISHMGQSSSPWPVLCSPRC